MKLPKIAQPVQRQVVKSAQESKGVKASSACGCPNVCIGLCIAGTCTGFCV